MNAAGGKRPRRPSSATKERPSRTGRFSSLLVVLILGLLAITGLLMYIQVVKGPAYAAAAAKQRTRAIAISPQRGMIFDREGEVLAESVEARTVYAVPTAVGDKPAAANASAS